MCVSDTPENSDDDMDKNDVNTSDDQWEEDGKMDVSDNETD